MGVLGIGLAWALSSAAVPAATAALDPIAGPSRPVQSGTTPFDQAAREKQVASGDQRIAPMSAADFANDPEAQRIAASLQAFFGSKKDGMKTFATMFKHPGLYKGQMQLGLELNQHGKLPPREREMVILRTAWLVRSPFEWGEHVAYGKKLGLTGEEVERITRGSSAPGWNEHDRAVLRGVEELLGDHAVSSATWATLAKTWDEPQLIELPGLVGSYTMTAMIYNSLRFGLLEGNEGFKTR